MKSVSVFMSFALTICSGMSLPSDQETPQETLREPIKQLDEDIADEFVVSLLPLKILLEYQLRNQDEWEHVSSEKEFHIKEKPQGNFTAENLKSFPATLKDENTADDFCTTASLMKNLTDFSNILNNSKTIKENLFNKEQMRRIYNSLRGCFFAKARNSKLWGPLWHCLNRLFLFFVFN